MTAPGQATPMERIAVIGCGGAGKSTFSRRLGAILDLPVHHLDTVFWRAGWVPIPRAEFAEAQRELTSAPRWIIDGNYRSTMDVRFAVADTIVFLDYPMIVCLGGALRRWARCRFLGEPRPDMTPGHLERFDASYVSWIISYRLTRRAAVLERLSALPAGTSVVALRSRREADAFIEVVSRVARD